MHRRQVGQSGLTLVEIISYIVLCTFIILYICMFVSISRYVQGVKQKPQIEKSVAVFNRRWITNGWIGTEINGIEDKSPTVINVVERNSLLNSVSQAMKYEYKKIPSADCPDTDIKRLYGDVKACSKECDTIHRCIGFVFGFNKEVEKTYCWLKKHECNIVPSVADLYLKPRFKTHQPTAQAISTQAGATAQQTHPEAHSTANKNQKQNQKKDDYDYDVFQK